MLMCRKAVDRSKSMLCRDETLIHRLRIGHSYVTQGHFVQEESPISQSPSVIGVSSRIDSLAHHSFIHVFAFT